MLKLTLDESKICKLIEATIKELERGTYIELRGQILDNYIKKIMNNIEKVEDVLNQFLLKKGFFRNLKNLCFNDTFGSLRQFKVELINRYNCEEVTITTSDKINLDALFIRAPQSSSLNNSANSNNSNEDIQAGRSSRGHSPNISLSLNKDQTNSILSSQPVQLNLNQMNSALQQKEKSVMIICTPNAAPYEIFAYSDKWVEYYLESGINVFLWNYRGFGESKGSVNFQNIKKDAECIADFIKKYYKSQKIGVHGISIGGLPACHLAG
jgi:hypothetical protein